jgi:hypothetical protein
MTTYTENKRLVLALAQERGAEGFATHECPDPGLVRTWVSELREEGHRFVTFRLPAMSEARYALADAVGTRHDDYAALRAVHPDAVVKKDDRLPSKRKPKAEPFAPSARADEARKSARRRAHELRRKEATAGELEIYMRGRRRLLESIENATSIPAMLMSEAVPVEDVESLLEDLTDLRAYADTLIAFIQGKVGDAAFMDRLTKLRNVEGRPPEEAAAFLAMADKLEQQRQHRLSA